jgi:hypothetical protein
MSGSIADNTGAPDSTHICIIPAARRMGGSASSPPSDPPTDFDAPFMTCRHDDISDGKYV